LYLLRCLARSGDGSHQAANPIILILTGAWRGRNRLLVVAAEGWLLARYPNGGFRCIFGRMPSNSRRLAIRGA